MIELSTDSKILYQRIHTAKKLLKDSADLEEKIALYNYIENVYKYISIVDNKDFCNSKKHIFGGLKNYKKYINKNFLYEDEMVDNFILNKDYISKYLKNIVKGVDDLTPDVIDSDIKIYQELNVKDFNDIFYQFMRSINLEEFFDNYSKNNSFFNYRFRNDKVYGATLYNPVNGDTDILIGDFIYDINALFALTHETGHMFDMKYFNKDIKSYNNYFYKSFYNEVCSKLFERLFFNFMINNDILKEEAKVLLFNTIDDNYWFVFGCYMMSCLSDDLIISDEYSELSPEEIYNNVKKYFDYEVVSFLEEKEPFNLQDDFSYAFGDIISMFLFDSINKYGFNNDLINKFIDERDKMFRKEFLKENGLSSDNYIELYKKELKLLRK